MLFPKSGDVTRVWKLIVEGIINDRLGPIAKVAPDDGKDERLICIYTKVKTLSFHSTGYLNRLQDFRDEEDVLRVLQELDSIGLLKSGRSIYYKSDVYTLPQYLQRDRDEVRLAGQSVRQLEDDSCWQTFQSASNAAKEAVNAQ